MTSCPETEAKDPRDIALGTDAMKRGDVKAVGYVIRNAVSAVLVRLDCPISQTEATPDPGEPRITS